jgi:hypothetical protein
LDLLVKKEKRENVVHKGDKVSLDSRETKEETALLVQLVLQVLLVFLVQSEKRVTRVQWVLPVLRETLVKLVLQVHLVLLVKD